MPKRIILIVVDYVIRLGYLNLDLYFKHYDLEDLTKWALRDTKQLFFSSRKF